MGLAQQILHGGDAEELLFVGVESSLGDSCGYDSLIGVLPVGSVDRLL